jgi:hypothetical protein
MSLELTAHDLLRLEQHRLNRLHSVFPDLLAQCVLSLDAEEDTLTVHCSAPWIVDALISKLDLFRWQVSLILGVQQISICFVGQEIFRASTRRSKHRLKQATRL